MWKKLKELAECYGKTKEEKEKIAKYRELVRRIYASKYLNKPL